MSITELIEELAVLRDSELIEHSYWAQRICQHTIDRLQNTAEKLCNIRDQIKQLEDQS